MENPDDLVLAETDKDGVRLLTLNRPERHNAYTLELEAAYFARLAEAAADPRVRAVVVTGAGRSFCPGLDSQALEEVSAEGTKPVRDRTLLFALQVPKPIVCAVNGACAGLGLVLALTCDVRFAARGAKITTAFARRGLPAEGAVSWLLTRLVGHGVALDLLLSGRVIVAEEAHTLGVVNFLAEPDEVLDAALAYASDMARHCSPVAMAAAKRQVYLDLERASSDAQEAAFEEATALRTHPDLAEGVRSFKAREAPAFEGLSAPLGR